MNRQIIVTGGLGYIGSHTIVELKNCFDEFIIIDDLSNSNLSVIHQLEKLTGKKIIHFSSKVTDQETLKNIFEKYNPINVIHFAGLKSVQESEKNPEKYFFTNVTGTETLLNVIKEFDCKNFIFSSSATVYGNPEYLPYDENHPTKPINNYGRSKLIAEQLIHQWSIEHEISSISLRYFNPVGAHHSGLIGEKPNGVPNNLMPYILEVISGNIKELNIFGNDYNTKDGTGERDYIHVVDLAKAHVAALNYANSKYVNDFINIGTGSSISVLDIINIFETRLHTNIKYRITERRAGDLPQYFAKTKKAKDLLNWESDKDLFDMCADSLRWQKNYNKA
tara:strand:- start:5622 stop:6629 length:1008 start_codon:yes stop_codon:yes gene_type:complete